MSDYWAQGASLGVTFVEKVKYLFSGEWIIYP
jgi:hypothetical protein